MACSSVCEIARVGKTTTVVELVRQLVARQRRVLLCAPSNTAVDNLVERLAPCAERGELKLMRLGHAARIQENLLQYVMRDVLLLIVVALIRSLSFLVGVAITVSRRSSRAVGQYGASARHSRRAGTAQRVARRVSRRTPACDSGRGMVVFHVLDCVFCKITHVNKRNEARDESVAQRVAAT